MLTVRRMKVVVFPVIGVYDEGWNLVAEMQMPEAHLFQPMMEQLDNLLGMLEERAQKQIEDAGTVCRIHNGKQTVTGNGQLEKKSPPDRSRRAEENTK